MQAYRRASESKVGDVKSRMSRATVAVSVVGTLGFTGACGGDGQQERRRGEADRAVGAQAATGPADEAKRGEEGGEGGAADGGGQGPLTEAQLEKAALAGGDTKGYKVARRSRRRAEPKPKRPKRAGTEPSAAHRSGVPGNGEGPRGTPPAGPFGVSTDVRAASVPGSGAGGLRRLLGSRHTGPVGDPAHWGRVHGLDHWQSGCAMRLSGAGCPCIVLDGARPPQPFRPPLDRFRRSAPGVPEADRSPG